MVAFDDRNRCIAVVEGRRLSGSNGSARDGRACRQLSFEREFTKGTLLG
jgi:hypothetical protein